MHAGSSLCDLARHAMSLRELQKETDVRSEKGFDRRQNSTNHAGGQGNSPNKVKVVKKEGSTFQSTGTPMTNF